jgi:hypothetical protein
LNYRIIGRPSVLSFDRLLFTILHNIEELPEWAHALYVFVAQVFPSLSYYSCMLICCTPTHCEISDLVSFLVVMLCGGRGVAWLQIGGADLQSLGRGVYTAGYGHTAWYSLVQSMRVHVILWHVYLPHIFLIAHS